MVNDSKASKIARVKRERQSGRHQKSGKQPKLQQPVAVVALSEQAAHGAVEARLVGGMEWMHGVGYGPLDGEEAR